MLPVKVQVSTSMGVVYDDMQMEDFFAGAARASGDHPVLVDQFLEDAVEFDVDAVCDGGACATCGGANRPCCPKTTCRMYTCG